MSAAAIQSALRETGITAAVRATRDLSGGCIHRVTRVELEDGRAVAVKTNRADLIGLFEEEAAGLAALAATGTVLVPRPLGVSAQGGVAALVMACLEPGPADDAAWRRLGEHLAALHAAEAGDRYGFETDNHLGTTPQVNTWCDDWVRFNAEHRLGFQVRRAVEGGRLNRNEARRIEALIDRLGDLLPARPKPALLHGDLWSGNALPTVDERGEATVAIIDPAVYVGDGWADIAMMRLFGRFSRGCFEAYAAHVDDHDGVEERIAVYQLYHVLNHVNIFGRGYAGQALALADRLT